MPLKQNKPSSLKIMHTLLNNIETKQTESTTSVVHFGSVSRITLFEFLKSKSSSTSCHTASTDLPDPLSPPVSIVYRTREVFKAISSIGTKLLYIGSSWSSYVCSSMWRGQHEFVLTSPAVSCMSGSSYLNSFRDGWLVAVQLLFSLWCCLLDLVNIPCSILV